MAAYINQPIFLSISVTGTNGNIYYIDDITMPNLYASSCNSPTDLSATVSPTSAILGWTVVGTVSNFTIQHGTPGFALGTGTQVATTTNSHTLTGLVANTSYQYYVRADCGVDDGSSDWAGPYTFSTACPTINLPYVENFDGVSVPNLPMCMSRTNDNGDFNTWKTSTEYAKSLPNAMSITFNTTQNMNDWFYTPSLNLEAGKTYKLDFYYRGEASYSEKLEVKFGISANAASMTSAPIFNNANIVSSSFTLASNTFSVPTTGVYNVGFHGYSDPNMSKLSIDNISITELLPVSCNAPIALEATNLFFTSAVLGWTSPASNFKIRHREVGSTPWTNATASTTSLQLTTLIANTTYEFQVQAVCAPSDSSAWATAVQFTNASCAVPTSLEVNTIFPTSANLAWTSEALSFKIRHRKVGTTPWTVLTSNSSPISLTGLIANTEYEFQVQALCSINDISLWANVVTFTTLNTGECLPPSNLTVTNITSTTAVLGWTGSASNYHIRYRAAAKTPWTNATSSTNSLALTSLTANSEYEFEVMAFCSAIDSTAWSTTSLFNTASPEDPCEFPIDLIATNVSSTTAVLGWTSTAPNFKIRYSTTDATTWTNATATSNSLILTELTPNTEYEFEVQAVCTSTDSSEWAYAFQFTTLAPGVTCNAPSALTVTAIDVAGATLNWTDGGTETAWNIRHKKVADATYTEDNNTTTKPYILTSLQSSTAYVWNVKAVCSVTLSSEWSAENTFTTTVGVENNSLSNLSVYSYNNQVNVINNENLLVKAVVFYDMIGQEVATYAINSTDNILINTNFTTGNYVVKIVTDTQVMTKKLNIK